MLVAVCTDRFVQTSIDTDRPLHRVAQCMLVAVCTYRFVQTSIDSDRPPSTGAHCMLLTFSIGILDGLNKPEI